MGRQFIPLFCSWAKLFDDALFKYFKYKCLSDVLEAVGSIVSICQINVNVKMIAPALTGSHWS